MEATETKLAQHEGEYTDYVELEDNTTREKATDMAFRLLAAYPAEDPALNSKITVDVIIADMPRPRYDVEPIDIKPTVSSLRKEITNARPAEPAAQPTMEQSEIPSCNFPDVDRLSLASSAGAHIHRQFSDCGHQDLSSASGSGIG